MIFSFCRNYVKFFWMTSQAKLQSLTKLSELWRDDFQIGTWYLSNETSLAKFFNSTIIEAQEKNGFFWIFPLGQLLCRDSLLGVKE